MDTLLVSFYSLECQLRPDTKHEILMSSKKVLTKFHAFIIKCTKKLLSHYTIGSLIEVLTILTHA